MVKNHLKTVTLEQNAHDILPKQAVPLMFDKLGSLCRYMSYQIYTHDDTTMKYLMYMDRAYFSMLCHSGDRVGDLGLLTFDRLFTMPLNQGILISEIAGKTVSPDNPKKHHSI